MPPRIKYYTSDELEDLTDDQLDHLRLVSRVLDIEDFANVDATELEQMTDDQLRHILRDDAPARTIETTHEQSIKKTPKKKGRPNKQIIASWEKINTNYEVRDGVLVCVELWRVSNAVGVSHHERVILCSDRVMYEGRTVAASLLQYYLKTGKWVKRVPKLKSALYKAQVRDGAKVHHLGYFATLKERDAAVFAYRLGVYPNGLK